jgi:hypothetical protein
MAPGCKSGNGDAEQDAVRTEAGFSIRCSISRGGMTHEPRNTQRFVEVLSVNRR